MTDVNRVEDAERSLIACDPRAPFLFGLNSRGVRWITDGWTSSGWNGVRARTPSRQPASPVKAACAQIVRNAQSTPALNVRRGRLDRMYMDYFSDSLLDDTVRELLAPYVAQKVG